MAAPFSKEERTRRSVALTLAEISRGANGAQHQDEPLLVVGEAAGPHPFPPPQAGEGEARLPRIVQDGAPVDRWVCTETGMRRWRPIVDQISVTPLPGGGRLFEIGRQFMIRLDAEQAAHLARLLGAAA